MACANHDSLRCIRVALYLEAVPKFRFTLSERFQPEARRSRKTPVFVEF